jgi:signal transduction histidine kinase
MFENVSATMTILAIEDDLDAQSNLRDILELDGYHVRAAASLREALAHNDWTEFSAILLDRKLPDGLADSLLPRIKQLAPEAAVIIITGQTDLDGTITALRHGAADYLLKPINPDLLRATLARVAQVKEMERRALQAERLAAIGQMVAGLAHESGNALARSQACLEMLALEVEDLAEAKDLIERIQRAQNDLQRLFEEIRNYAAPLKLQREECDLGGIWRQAWTHLSVQHGGRQVVLRSETDGHDLECLADPFRLEQVFRNIFENALAACKDPVEIDVTCRPSSLHGHRALTVAVRDNGPGLSAEQQRRMFEPFFTTKTKGTGLGMAIARRILEAHGGEILAGGEPGRGAEIRITLPRGTT